MFSHIKELFTRPSGYSIAKSVRLRSSASAYFNRTPASASNRKTYTFSCWAKRGSLSSNQNIVAQGNNEVLFRFNTTDNINFADYTGGSAVWEITSSSVYRDPSAWYHIVFAVDTTQATSSNRVKVWINNSQVTFTGTYPTLNSDTPFNTTNAMLIGNRTGVSQYFDGYLTEINFIDGQALTPSSFGETDSITGVWKAKKYSGTYGTNGFYLNFSDNSSNTATTIGKDYSGNGNNWTPNNISVTAGVTYDSMVDSPTTSAVSSNYAVMNPLQTGSYATLSNANLRITGNTATNAGGSLSTIGSATGKWYYEAVVSSTGSSHMGVVTYWAGNMANLIDENNVYGASGSNKGIGVRGIGTTYGNAAEKQTISAFTFAVGDIVGIAIDADNGAVYFSVNGNWLNSGVPTSGASRTGSFHNWTPSNDRVCYPAASGYNGGYVDANFGQRPFSYTPPTGFVALNTYNLPASTIKNGAAYMAATTYTGTGSAQNITNSGSFQPDFVWIKNRGGAYGHGLVDSVRGRASVLYSNDTAAQGTSGSTQDVTAFNSNGFALGTNSQIECNASGQSYIGWQWKAGGTSSSNTNGSITSSVSAGATQGFSVVTWTGNGSASATVGHGLGVAPSMVIAKERTGTDYWHVWHTTLPNQQLYLNVTNAAVSITSGAPGPTDGGLENMTSSTFGFKTSSGGNVNSVNENGILNVAYCFAAVAGYSAFGSYTGNGSADGPFVFTNFRPRWILLKRTDSAADWFIGDTSRNTANSVNNLLQPSSANAESTYGAGAGEWYDLLSNGFKIRSTITSFNASGGTYIYACFAENPLKYALAR